jgi:hypothetical protein
MRLRALAPLLLSWIAAAAAVSMCAILCTLDQLGNGVSIATVARGDIHEFVMLPRFWIELRDAAVMPFLLPLHYVTQLCVWRVMLPIAFFATSLAMLWRRRGRTDYARAGMLCLLFALVPWFLGRYLLTGIHADQEAGQFLVVMVAGLFWCAVGSLVLCAMQAFPRRGAVLLGSASCAPACSQRPERSMC